VVIDFSVEQCVIGEKFKGGSWGNMGGHVVYVKNEMRGPRTVPCGTPELTCT